MYILTIATHFQYLLGFSKLHKQFYAEKMLKIPFFYQKSDINEKISDEFICLFFFSIPHVPENKWHSGKNGVFMKHDENVQLLLSNSLLSNDKNVLLSFNLQSNVQHEVSNTKMSNFNWFFFSFDEWSASTFALF